MDYTDEPPISFYELVPIVGRYWATKLIDRSSIDILVFLSLLEQGTSCVDAWEAMEATV